MHDKTQIVLDGADIRLKIICPDNVNASYVSWLNDPDINQYLESRYCEHTLESVSEFVASMLASDNNYLFGIFLADQHIGNIKLGSVNTTYARADIGLLLGEKSAWGKGYASQAIQLLSDWAFSQLNLKRLEAGCYADNMGSKRAFEKNGFQVEGVLRSHFRLDDGQWQDCIILGKLNPHYQDDQE